MRSTLLLGLALLLLSFCPACDEEDDKGTNQVDDGTGTIVPSNPDPTRNISLAGVTGLSGGKVPSGQSVTLSLKIRVDVGFAVQGMTNGFRIYSPDGARWTTSSIDTTGTIGGDDFDGGAFLISRSVTGMDVDTVGFAGFTIFSTGLPEGFDEVALMVDIGPINSSYAGRHICIDSSYYPPSGTWKWAGANNADAIPSWDGPHCWEIAN